MPEMSVLQEQMMNVVKIHSTPEYRPVFFYDEAPFGITLYERERHGEEYTLVYDKLSEETTQDLLERLLAGDEAGSPHAILLTIEETSWERHYRLLSWCMVPVAMPSYLIPYYVGAAACAERVPFPERYFPRELRETYQRLHAALPKVHRIVPAVRAKEQTDVPVA